MTDRASARRACVRAGGRLLSVVVGAALWLVVAAPPAGAHDAVGAGTPSSNYRVEVVSAPEADGVRFRLGEAGTRAELTNTSSDEVVVLDYEGDPYLRVGPGGVFENASSVAAYLNDALEPTTEVPEGAGEGAPEWRRVSDGPTATWHDHRAHWMTDDPAEVRDDPSRVHRVATWAIPLEIDGRVVDVTGTITWVPPPPAWQWLTVAVLIAVAAMVLLLLWPSVGLAAAGVISAGSFALHLAGVWSDSSEPAVEKLAVLGLPVLAVALLGAAAWTSRGIRTVGGNRESRRDAAGMAAGAAVVTLLVTVAGAGDWLFTSQLPTALDPDVARAAVVVLLGVSAGTLVWSVVVLTGSLRGSRRSLHPDANWLSDSRPGPGI